MTDCERCGGAFRVELCDVGGGAGAPRDRIEAYLCYDCRQEVPHERLGVTDGGRDVEDTANPQTGDKRSGTINVGIKIASLATELGFQAGEYEVEDVWVAGDSEIEVDLRKVDAGGEN